MDFIAAGLPPGIVAAMSAENGDGGSLGTSVLRKVVAERGRTRYATAGQAVAA
jgi:hypothetical protein